MSLLALYNVTLFYFEENFEIHSFTKWHKNQWHVPLLCAPLYLTFVFCGVHLMKKREKFQLQNLLAMWNFGLAAFSIFCAFRTVPPLLQVLQEEDGFYASVCENDVYYDNKVLAAWAWLYSLSKIVEFGDTAFIILRRSRLIFLHWVHHAIVMVHAWFSLSLWSPIFLWLTSMNLTVHCLMYTYYALNTLKFKIPKLISVTITTLQIIQFVMSILLTIAQVAYTQRGLACRTSNTFISWNLILSTFFLVLFVQFFYNAYLTKPDTKEEKCKTK